MSSPNEEKTELDKFVSLANEIKAGIDGKKFSWSDGEGHYKTNRAAQMGITLITKSRAEKMGYCLKRTAKPIGNRYFGSPIKRYADLYILECHCSFVGVPQRQPDVPKVETNLAGKIRIRFDSTSEKPIVYLEAIDTPVDGPDHQRLILIGEEIADFSTAITRAKNLLRDWYQLKRYEEDQKQKSVGRTRNAQK